MKAQTHRRSNNGDADQHGSSNPGSGNHRFSSGTAPSSVPSPSPVSQTSSSSYFDASIPRKNVGIRGGGAFCGAIDSDSENEEEVRGVRRFLAKVSLGSAGSGGGIEPKRSKSSSRMFKGFRST
ncbi:hypothetical protein HDU82_005298 [Entophlyctis luteolus]|nr:hypothetical protein HDU82_005298 [Entophlyctis luteolus]